MPKIPLIFVKGKINMLWSGEVAGQLLAMVCLLCWCSAGALLWWSPLEGRQGQAGDVALSITPSPWPPSHLWLLLVLACLLGLLCFWNFTETYFDQLSLKNNKDNKHIITHDIAIPSQIKLQNAFGKFSQIIPWTPNRHTQCVAHSLLMVCSAAC